MDSEEVNGLPQSFSRYLEDNMPVLNSNTRKYVASYLMENEDTDLEELVREASKDLDIREDSVEIRFHHNDLPRLEDEGLINYEIENDYIELQEEGRKIIGWMEEFGLM